MQNGISPSTRISLSVLVGVCAALVPLFVFVGAISADSTANSTKIDLIEKRVEYIDVEIKTELRAIRADIRVLMRGKCYKGE